MIMAMRKVVRHIRGALGHIVKCVLRCWEGPKNEQWVRNVRRPRFAGREGRDVTLKRKNDVLLVLRSRSS